MVLFKLAVAGAAGYALYRMITAEKSAGPVAFAPGESVRSNFGEVRNAGPDAMRSDLPSWDEVDEASDESFPASDPPAKY